MSIQHHPRDETLMRFAAGTLGAGPALVVTVHMERCPACREALAEFECIGGALLDDMPKAPLAADALGRTLERLQLEPQEHAPSPVSRKQADLGITLPEALRDCDIGPWRWLGPGFKWSKVSVAGAPDANIMLIKGKAGLRLPSHGHTGTEFMQILSGSLSDERGLFLPGDMDEADDDVDHEPVVGGESECICLAAVEGKTRLHGFLGRLFAPLVGF